MQTVTADISSLPSLSSSGYANASLNIDGQALSVAISKPPGLQFFKEGGAMPVNIFFVEVIAPSAPLFLRLCLLC